MDIELLMNMSNKKKVFHDGQVIINEGGSMGNEMYIILVGEVKVFKNHREPDEVQIAALSPGEFFGEMTLFLNKSRSATIVAKGTVVLLEIDRVNAYDFFERQPEATYSLIKTLCLRLDEANNANVSRLTGRPPDTASFVYAPDADAPVKQEPEQKSEAAPKSKPVKKNPRDLEVFEGLFPDGHRTYDYEIGFPPANVVVHRNYTCPVCDRKFKAPSLRTTNLKVDHMDKDFRIHYTVDADPIHYDVVTCPDCCYSTFGQAFNQPVLPSFVKNISRIKVFKDKVALPFEDERDVNAVFAGFFLALKSAPLFYIRHETTTAKIWLRLVWLYRDCGDARMERFAADQGYKAYLNVLEQADLGPDALQQLYITLGELCMKLDDLPTAKKYFFQAKTSVAGKPVMAQQAEERLTEIRELESAQ